MSIALESNKAKIAKRVVEVLEFFDEHNRHATVMDIVRRYKRPQSSTSELLASLVDLGLLYKDASSRSYTLTPRAAILGSTAQPEFIRDGRLSLLIDRLVAQTGLGVALVGMVGLNAQIFRWKTGSKPLNVAPPEELASGVRGPLYESAAGWLLLSTISQMRRDGFLRRMNAEAPDERKFCFSDMSEQVKACEQQGYSDGLAGFGTKADMCSVLLPTAPDERPMALGFIYDPSDRIDPAVLVSCLREAIDRCFNPEDGEMAAVRPLSSAA